MSRLNYWEARVKKGVLIFPNIPQIRQFLSMCILID